MTNHAGGDDGGEPQPHLRATSFTTLAAIAGVSAVTGWVLTREFYADFPDLPWFGSAALLVLALLEFLTGRVIKDRIARKPGTEPIEPLVVARLAALAKASSLLGSMYAGLFAGIAARLARYPGEISAAERDLPMAGLGVLAGVVLLIGALLLEYACRIPPPPNAGDQSEHVTPVS